MQAAQVTIIVPQTVPRPVLRFVRRHIQSVTQLEVLLLLLAKREAWSPTAVAIELRLTPRSAEIKLSDLRAQGFSVYSAENDTYMYAPRTAAQHSIINALAACYPSMQHRLIAVIFGGDSATRCDSMPRPGRRRQL